MGIALIIAGGVVLMTFFASGFDYLTKRRKKLDDETKKTVAEMEKRLASLEQVVKEKDDRMTQLEGDLSFMKKLIEK
jgi:ethanolamine utilization cobalamin adenosyltransferase